MPSSSYEVNARAKKASHIALLIWSRLDSIEQRNPSLPWSAGEQPAEFWTGMSRAAGHPAKLPSQTTRDAVIIELCRLVNAARRGETAPCTYENCIGGWIYWGDDLEERCPECKGYSAEMCECCREAPAVVVVPLGHYCETCAAQDHPELARWARLVAGEPEDPFEGLTERTMAAPAAVTGTASTGRDTARRRAG